MKDSIDCSLLIVKANNKKPICYIVLYAKSLFILDWARPTTVPIIKENKELISNKFFITS